MIYVFRINFVILIIIIITIINKSSVNLFYYLCNLIIRQIWEIINRQSLHKVCVILFVAQGDTVENPIGTPIFSFQKIPCNITEILSIERNKKSKVNIGTTRNQNLVVVLLKLIIKLVDIYFQIVQVYI